MNLDPVASSPQFSALLSVASEAKEIELGAPQQSVLRPEPRSLLRPDRDPALGPSPTLRGLGGAGLIPQAMQHPAGLYSQQFHHTAIGSIGGERKLTAAGGGGGAGAGGLRRKAETDFDPARPAKRIKVPTVKTQTAHPQQPQHVPLVQQHAPTPEPIQYVAKPPKEKSERRLTSSAGGSSCHQCKSRRNFCDLTYCTTAQDKKNKSIAVRVSH